MIDDELLDAFDTGEDAKEELNLADEEDSTADTDDVDEMDGFHEEVEGY